MEKLETHFFFRFLMQNYVSVSILKKKFKSSLKKVWAKTSFSSPNHQLPRFQGHSRFYSPRSIRVECSSAFVCLFFFRLLPNGIHWTSDSIPSWKFNEVKMQKKTQLLSSRASCILEMHLFVTLTLVASSICFRGTS